MKKIGFEWKDTEAEGAIELFDTEDLYSNTKGKLVRSFFKRKNASYWESCISVIRVEDNIACLDVTPFPEQNKKLNLYSGILKLVLSGSAEYPSISEVYFKSEGSEDFIRAKIEFVCKSLRTTKAIKASIDENFELQVLAMEQLSSEDRVKLLPPIGTVPKKFMVSTAVYDRSPVVVAEALIRAKGVCEKCRKTGPFISPKTGRPFLEVHHKIRLADGGSDDIENVIALCPNCHRELHFAKQK